jgi:hypothetical protein
MRSSNQTPMTSPPHSPPMSPKAGHQQQHSSTKSGATSAAGTSRSHLSKASSHQQGGQQFDLVSLREEHPQYRIQRDADLPAESRPALDNSHW